ncbi:MAG: putative bifunctional diguanylate cyclase/phosphodiesterase [Acidithiobacillus sp.]
MPQKSIGEDTGITQEATNASQINKRLTVLLNMIPDMLIFKDGEGRWLVTNDTAKMFFQLEGISWQGKTDLELIGLHPEFRAIHEKHLAEDEKAWQTGLEVVVGESLAMEGGQLATFDLRRVPLFNRDGQREGLVIIGRNITERKTADMALQEGLKHQRQLADFNLLLGEINQAIALADDEQALLYDICALAIRYTNMSLAWIGKPDARGDFQVLAAAGETRHLDGNKTSSREDFAEGRGPTGRAWRQQQAIYNAELSQDPSMGTWRECAAHYYGLRDSASLPIHRGGSVWAVLNIYKDSENAFDTDIRSILEEVAKDIGFGLDRLDLFHQERDALIFNAALLNNLTAGVIVLRYPDRIIEQANVRTLEIFGATAMETMVGHSMRNFFPDDASFQRVGETAREILVRSQGMSRDVPYQKLDGSLIYVDISGQKLPRKEREPERIVWTLVDVTERHNLMEELAKYSLSDPLTALPNRRALDAELDRAVARADRSEKLLAVCMLDLDGFKPVNDTYGHDAGDYVLQILAKRLQSVLRRTDFVARLGGDEFVILAEELDRMDPLESILDKIGEAVHAPIALEDGQTVRIGLSMGVCIYPFVEGDESDALLRLADQALYQSKAHKTDREHFWVLFGEERSVLHTPAQHLLDAGALEVWYQPVLSGGSRKVVGVEALARLRDDNGRILYPAEFLPQLSVDDLTNLSSMVLTQALEDLKKLDNLGWSLWVSFNVVPESFCGSCVPCLQGVIGASGVAPQRITLEILEGSDFLERNVALSALQGIKEMGIRLALDDVGSAYASLLRLKELPIDEIKLDQGFVRFLGERPQDLHFVRTIQDLASELQLDLVVEGVETPDILDAMLTTGVPYLQGYAISKPLPLTSLQQFLSGYAIDTGTHPASLFGLYAGTLKLHTAIKNMLLINSTQLDIASLADGHQCRGHSVLHRFGYGDDSHLVQLHNAYHLALGAIARDTSDHGSWKVMEFALNEFLQALLGARHHRLS